MMRPTSFKFADAPLLFWLFGFGEFLAATHGWPAHTPGLLAWPLSLVAFIYLLWREFPKSWIPRPPTKRAARAFGWLLVLTGAILIFGFFAALKPPHLPQEYDAINYHMGLARQHLLAKNWAWIPWSVADLWPASAQSGLSAYWFSFSHIQKIPQWILSCGFFLVLLQLGQRLQAGWLGWVPMLALLGAHGFGIQIGSAMMDLPLCYFALAGILAFLEKRWAVAALQEAVFISSKFLHPFQFGWAIAILCVAVLFWRRDLRQEWRTVFLRFLGATTVLSLLLLARPVYVSWQITGTPLFPLLPCLSSSAQFCGEDKLAVESSRQLIKVKEQYGAGRGIDAFANHLWRISVPTKGVNNEFDYPLGLPWILLLACSALGLLFMPRTLLRSPWFWLFLSSWALWWFGSQQSRWLYLPMSFGWLAILPVLQLAAPWLLLTSLCAGTALSVLSQIRAQLPTLLRSNAEIQREQEDKVLWDDEGRLMSKELLYVPVPAERHTPGDPQFILTKTPK